MARLLESDLVATALIREHLKPERLYEILGLEAPAEEATIENDDDFDELMEVLSRFSKSEVLEALNDLKLK